MKKLLFAALVALLAQETLSAQFSLSAYSSPASSSNKKIVAPIPAANVQVKVSSSNGKTAQNTQANKPAPVAETEAAIVTSYNDPNESPFAVAAGQNLSNAFMSSLKIKPSVRG